jgi:hypothetical protein
MAASRINSIIPFALLLYGPTACAQPEWRFHLAFEDGTGAKDTIWMVYDLTATLGTNPWPGPNVDTLLGEGPVNVNDGLFHVFLTNALGDTTNTNAYPYSAYPIFDGTIIDAMNWIPPMTITWDTSLFHAPYLPYVQGSIGLAVMDGLAFSAYSNHPELGFGVYDMLLDDSLTIDFLSDFLFQFGVGFGADDHVNTPWMRSNGRALSIWPTPARAELHLRSTSVLDDLLIMDLSGRIVRSLPWSESAGTIPIADLASGTYLLRARSRQNQLYHVQFQKVD